MSSLDNHWTLKEGLEVLRALQPDTRQFGYHLTIGGGVVNTGTSEKDLDLFFLPLDQLGNPPRPHDLLKYLQELWGTGDNLSRMRMAQVRQPDGRLAIQAVTPYPSTPHSLYLIKWKFYRGGLRIDAFILGMTNQKEKTYDSPGLDAGPPIHRERAPLGGGGGGPDWVEADPLGHPEQAPDPGPIEGGEGWQRFRVDPTGQGTPIQGRTLTVPWIPEGTPTPTTNATTQWGNIGGEFVVTQTFGDWVNRQPLPRPQAQVTDGFAAYERFLRNWRAQYGNPQVTAPVPDLIPDPDPNQT